MKVIRREESNRIAFDRVYNGQTFHHTGDDALLEDGKWYYEYICPETGEVTYW